MHNSRLPRLSFKRFKKILNEATDRNISIPESDPEPKPEPPILSLKILKNICDEATDRNSAITEPEPPRLSL